MKKIDIKRIAALIVCLVLSLGILPSVSSARAADSITIGEFNEKLEKFISNHPDGSKYKPDNDGGSECFGFANSCAKYIFGSYPTSSGSAVSNVSKNWKIIRGSEGVDNLHVGDIVRYRGGDDGKGKFDHSIFVVDINGDDITYSDANSDWNNTIRHGKKISKKELETKVNRKLYGNKETKGYVAHFNEWFVCTWDHSAGAKHDGELVYKTIQKSNGEYSAVCKNCGEEFKLGKMNKQEGLYTFKAPSKNDSNANGIGSAPYAPACNHTGADGEQGEFEHAQQFFFVFHGRLPFDAVSRSCSRNAWA